MATRTWVSGVGDDANPGSRTAPCKTFPGAISKTDANGEIDAIDPGGFGSVTITKGITIDGGTGSGWASILASGTNGVVINAGGGDVVTLRNLSINGGQTGLIGVRILAAGAVLIENCAIFGFRSATAGSGIGIADSRTAGGALTVVNSTITGNVSGIVVQPSSGSARIAATIEDVRVAFNFGVGIRASSGPLLTLVRAVVNNNAGHGLLAEQAAGTTEVNVEGCVFVGNGAGIGVQTGTPVVRLSDSTITNNGAGIALTSGSVVSFGNNRIAANGSGNTPSAGVLSLK